MEEFFKTAIKTFVMHTRVWEASHLGRNRQGVDRINNFQLKDENWAVSLIIMIRGANKIRMHFAEIYGRKLVELVALCCCCLLPYTHIPRIIL